MTLLLLYEEILRIFPRNRFKHKHKIRIVGLKRIYRIFEYSFEIHKQMFVRFETNIRMHKHFGVFWVRKTFGDLGQKKTDFVVVSII